MFTEQQFSNPPLAGISEQTMTEHKKLYAGYVKNANAVLEKIRAYAGDESKAYELGELYRRFAFEFNGMRNHECYFALLTGANDAAPELTAAIEATWGDLASWKTAFVTLSLTRGIGWAMLSYDAASEKLLMHWVDEQHLGQLQGTAPVIALDLWEHSYVADYQPSGKKRYIENFFNNLNWSAAEATYVAARKRA